MLRNPRAGGSMPSARLLVLLLAVVAISFFAGFNLRSLMAANLTPPLLPSVPSSKVGSLLPPTQHLSDVDGRDHDAASLLATAADPNDDVRKPGRRHGEGDNDSAFSGGTGEGATADADAAACERTVRHHYRSYVKTAGSGAALRAQHGTLRIAAFSRLWVPPLHGTGGMQFHAYHLYSQLAGRGHYVHVFVTGPPAPHAQKTLRFRVDPATLKPVEVGEGEAATLVVQQVPSDHNGEYSETWYEGCLRAFTALNRTQPFHVAHSESWAGVPNTYQIGLPMAVTWHGSMLDWFRNEINLIVHNFRMRGKMTGPNTAHRMGQLGSSVAFEAYMLLTVPHHIVISDSAADDLAAINLVDPSRIHLIYNGVNPTNFKPADDRNAVRREFLQRHASDVLRGDKPEALFVVGCGGRLEGIKGHHQLSEAMRGILQTEKRVLLLVAGQGGQGERYEALKAKGLRVAMLGMLKQEDLAAFYQSLDVFVDPFYQHHGLNTVMLEATLSAVPIVATGLASAKTTAPCPSFGRTFALGDVQGLADAILFYYRHPEERARVAANVRERALSLFRSDVMAGSYEALLYRMHRQPTPLTPITGRVVCKKTYPAMCYREPTMDTSGGADKKK